MKLPITEDISIEGASGVAVLEKITRMVISDIDGDEIADCAAIFASAQGSLAFFVRASSVNNGEWVKIRPYAHVANSDSIDMIRSGEFTAYCESDEECIAGDFVQLTLKTNSFMFSGIGTSESIIFFDKNTKTIQERYLAD